MAEVKKNILTKGLSGMLGDTIVFRVKNGKTIVASAPQSSDKEPTEGQKAHRAHFQKAVLYAKNALIDEGQKEAYQVAADRVEGVCAYNIAVADFLKAPDIREVDLSGYTGHPGGTIAAFVTDDFSVQRVTVEIYNSDGSLVEQGEAAAADNTHWVYTATAENADVSGDKIVVKAYDLPGNETEQEQLLN